MIKDLKYFDGQLQPINRVPDDLKAIYSTCFEIDTRWLVEVAAQEDKWIDQSQSLNLYIPDSDGKKLDSAYKLAWIRGLKLHITYARWVRLMKSTSDTSGSNLNAVKPNDDEVKQCLIDDQIVRHVNNDYIYTDFVIYLIAVIATILVIMKLKQYENERIEALREAEKN